MCHSLHRSVLYSAIILSGIAITSCNNRQRERDFMRQQLDSLNQKIKSFQNEMEPDKYSLYDSVAKKYTEGFLEQFRSTLSGCISYIADLKEQFTQYCGDSAGLAVPVDQEANIGLTNKFFSKDGNAESLYYRLADTQKTLSSHNDDPVLEEEINKLTWTPKGEGAATFAYTYFNDVPPVAVMTILSKFVNDIDRLEKKVLQHILKNNNVTER